MSGRHMDSHMP